MNVPWPFNYLNVRFLRTIGDRNCRFHLLSVPPEADRAQQLTEFGFVYDNISYSKSYLQFCLAMHRNINKKYREKSLATSWDINVLRCLNFCLQLH